MANNTNDKIRVDVIGASEVASALDRVAKEQPRIFQSALAQEITNIKRSISAVMRNGKIQKVKFDPNARHGKGSWRGEALAPRDPITKKIHGKKGGGALGKDSATSVKWDGKLSVSVGYHGNLSQYAQRWQDGIPQTDMAHAVRSVLLRIMRKDGTATGHPFATREEHDNYYRRLYLDPPALHTSPERPFMEKIGELSRRDFVPGLLSLLQKKIDGRLAVLEKPRKKQ